MYWQKHPVIYFSVASSRLDLYTNILRFSLFDFIFNNILYYIENAKPNKTEGMFKQLAYNVILYTEFKYW